jgi:hypothetical protein
MIWRLIKPGVASNLSYNGSHKDKPRGLQTGAQDGAEQILRDYVQAILCFHTTEFLDSAARNTDCV